MSRTHSFVVTKPKDGIRTLQVLSEHLQAAVHVELSTVPMYLYAAYSLKTKGYSQWATGHSAQRTIIAVSIEEMLHMALARNVLVAIGRGADLTLCSEKSVPTYPGDMLHREPPLSLGLRKVSTEHMETFLGVEKPESSAPQAADDDVIYYRTLGEFYKYIKAGIEFLSSDQAAAKERINWDEARRNLWKFQYKRAFWNQNGGAQKPQYVVDKASALAVLDVIVEQGEGAPHDKPHLDPIYPPSASGKVEDSHYTKFQRIHDGVDGIGVVRSHADDRQKFTIDSDEVRWPIIDNPRVQDVNDSPVRKLMEFSNAAYCYVLALLDEIYRTPMLDGTKTESGSGTFVKDKRYGYERGFIAAMQGVLYPIADLLVRTPFKAGELKVPAPDGSHAGPPFEYRAFTVRERAAGSEKYRNPKQDLIELCRELTAFYRELGGDDGVEQQIHLLPDFELPGSGVQAQA